jgi:HEAT repeat protein
MGETIARFEQEVEALRAVSGVDATKFPLKWIKWETQFRSPNGTRAPIWREPEGDIGYVLASTHDSGIVVILCKDDGTCYPIVGYIVDKERKGSESLDYTAKGSPSPTLQAALSALSPIFAAKIEAALSERPAPDDISSDLVILKNDLISLPQPVLLLTPPTDGEAEGGEGEVQEDDDKIIPYPKQLPSDVEYWNITKPMKDFARHPADPMDTTLQDIASNPNLREVIGQRAILDAGALGAIIDVLRIRQAQHAAESRQSQQAAAAVQILSQISLSPNVRRVIANDDAVKVLLDILKKEERALMSGLFTTIANCCRNHKFRELVIKHEGVEPLIYQIKKSEFASQVCYVLWTLNRSEQSTQVMIKSHVLNGLEKFVGPNSERASEDLMLNITRLLFSIATYDQSTAEQLTLHQIAFFCQGLQSGNPDLVRWSAKAFTVFKISDDLQKGFQNAGGPSSLIRTLDNKVPKVIRAGLKSIAVVAQIKKLCEVILQSPASILPKLQNLWKHEDSRVRKSTLRALGVLTSNQQCSKWTIKQQNMMADLIEYLRSTDPDFVIYSARAIGAACCETENLRRLMDQNGVRKLWSLMKSPFSGVQAAATRALVPFLKSEQAPAIVRTFVDGLDLLVDLLRSNDPEVQASACMAISEVARDRENLAVMTDLGLVELLSRLLSTKYDSVRKPLADAIGVSANWANNRRRFGEEGAVDPLVSYLRPPSNNKDVHAATAKALRALSEDSENSNKLRHAGVVDYLLIMVESKDQDLQMAAAVAIRNIRTNCVRTEPSEK